MKKQLLALFAFIACFIAQPAIPQTAQQVIISGQVAYGLGWNATTVLLNYAEPSTTTCTWESSTVIEIPENTTNNQINLASLFPGVTTAVVYGWQDVTASPGQQLNWGLASSGARFDMAPAGFTVIRVTGSSPTIFVDNPSASQNAYLQVSCMGN